MLKLVMGVSWVLSQTVMGLESNLISNSSNTEATDCNWSNNSKQQQQRLLNVTKFPLFYKPWHLIVWHHIYMKI